MSLLARIVIGVHERPMRQRLGALVAGIAACEIVETATGADTLAAALENIPDLVVLSVHLPGFDGLAVCHNMRSTPGLPDVPIMLLGPASGSQHKYQAFYVGATDYMGLPLDAEEFVLRVKVHLRAHLRKLNAPRTTHALGLTLNADAFSVSLDDGIAIQLTRSEFAILSRLVQAHGQPVSAEVLLQDALRKPAGLVSPQLIHTHIRNLRKKLEPDPDNPCRLLRQQAGYFLRQP